MASAHADALLAADDVPWLPPAVASARDVVLYGAVSHYSIAATHSTVCSSRAFVASPGCFMFSYRR